MNKKCEVYQDKMHKSVEVMKKEFAAIRAGRANPAVLHFSNLAWRIPWTQP